MNDSVNWTGKQQSLYEWRVQPFLFSFSHSISNLTTMYECCCNTIRAHTHTYTQNMYKFLEEEDSDIFVAKEHRFDVNFVPTFLEMWVCVWTLNVYLKILESQHIDSTSNVHFFFHFLLISPSLIILQIPTIWYSNPHILSHSISFYVYLSLCVCVLLESKYVFKPNFSCKRTKWGKKTYDQNCFLHFVRFLCRVILVLTSMQIYIQTLTNILIHHKVRYIFVKIERMQSETGE